MSDLENESIGQTVSPGHQEVFELPSLGADMEYGTVLEWYLNPGDRFGRGDLVALVSTEKADIDVEIWSDGVVVEHLVEVGEEVPVGTPLLRLSTTETADGDGEPRAPDPSPAEPAPSGVETTEPKPTAPSVDQPQPVTSSRLSRSTPDGRVLASPLARTIAAERGIDLTLVTGTGPDGAIVARDLDRPLEPPALVEPVATADRATGPSSAPRTSDESEAEGQDRATRMRRAIADRMTKANREIPHYHLEIDIDLMSALEWLTRQNAERPVGKRLLPAVLFLKATAAAATAVPSLNGYWINDHLVPAGGVDIAVAISLRGGGLVTPMIRDVDQKSHDEVMADLAEIVAGARRSSLRSSWMTDVGITVTNLGDRGVDRVTGIIHPPQVALVGFGRVRERPWAVYGEVTVRPAVTVSLAADHRANDGVAGSRFLNRLADDLQTWEEA